MITLILSVYAKLYKNDKQGGNSCMRKVKSFLILLIFVLSLYTSVQASQDKKTEELGAAGIVLPVSTFDELYGRPYSKPDSISILEKNATINLSNITLRDAELGFTANVNYNNQIKELAAQGRLYKSYKQREKLINSIVGDLQDSNNNFDILLFEIYQDKAEDKMIVNPKLKNSPHLKIYLKDRQNNVLLFEFDLPKELKNIVINHDDRIDSTKDGFWFINVIQPYELKKIPADENMKRMLGVTKSNEFSTQGVGYFSDWAHDVIYYQSFYIGSDYYQCYSLPYGSWKALNITGDDTWILSFKVAEHVQVNGQTYRSLDNPFRYRNVRLAVGVGEKSSIASAIVDGRVESYSTGQSLILKIFERLYKEVVPGPSISEILSWINEIIDAGTNKTVTLGTSNIKLNDRPTSVEGVNSGNYEMYRYTDINGPNTGHYMVLHTTVQYESDTGTPATANGVMKIKWDVYYGGYPYDSASKEITFTYNVSP